MWDFHANFSFLIEMFCYLLQIISTRRTSCIHVYPYFNKPLKWSADLLNTKTSTVVLKKCTEFWSTTV